jgi:hypothetical protein
MVAMGEIIPKMSERTIVRKRMRKQRKVSNSIDAEKEES